MKVWIFFKGDTAPEWVEKFTGPGADKARAVFKRFTIAIRFRGITHLWPLFVNESSITLCVEGNCATDEITMTGGPTHLHSALCRWVL